ncbi:MAG: HAD family phosphatase [Verrucomicrobiales bacterium]|nr:HAD family phosphatase [Verrucomicrobiales bacterium]
MPKAFLFDVGNVIISFDFTITAQKLAPQCDVSPEEAFRRVALLTDRLESGHITAEEFIETAIERIGYKGSPLELRTAFEDIFTLNLPMVDFIESLHREQIPLHLLSNTNAIHVPFFEKTYPVFKCFSGRIYSHEVGCMKPSPEIYRIAIETLSLDPEETIYIDDLEANCAAGREAGLQTIRYDREAHEAFLSEVAGAISAK